MVPTVGSKEGVAMMASLLQLSSGDVVVQPRVSYPTYEIGTQVLVPRWSRSTTSPQWIHGATYPV